MRNYYVHSSALTQQKKVEIDTLHFERLGTAFCVANKTLLTKVFQCRLGTHHFQLVSVEMTGVEGFQSLTSGNTTYTGKCDGECCLRIAVTCVTSVPIGQALWICKGMIR
jgi:hypothetical protein